MRNFWLTLLFFVTTFIISSTTEKAVNIDVDEESDPELRIDKSQWKNPNDPLEMYGFGGVRCDSDEQINGFKEV